MRPASVAPRPRMRPTMDGMIATPRPVQAVPVLPAPVAAPAPIAAPPHSPAHMPILQTVGVAAPAPVAAPSPQPAAPAYSPPADPTQRRTLLDMSLPGEESHVREARFKWRSARAWVFRGTAVTLVLLLTVGGLFISQSYLKIHKAFTGTTGTAAALRENVNPELLKGEGDGRVNILLLGRGGGNHDGPDLTDTMMIASVDPVNHTETLFSLPRDLWVQVPGGGPMKINAAWETGEFKYLGKIRPGSTDPKAIEAGFSTVDQVVESTLGVPIHYNVIVDFQAFQQAVDTVGGVAVNVPTDLVDPTMAWENHNNPVLAKAGLDTFDGAAALRYVRSRETTSDFARAQRQRSVILALKSKVEQLGTVSNPMKIQGLLSAFGNNVSSDLSLSNANRLYSLLKDITDQNTYSSSMVDGTNNLVTTQNLKGQSIVVPKAGMFNFAAIQSYVRTQLKDPYIQKENAKVLVLNGTSMPGLASNKADELKSYGYNVIGVGNTPNGGWTQTTLVDLTHKDKYTKNYLQNRLGVQAGSSLADQTIPTNGADFVIIIGSNEAQPTQNPAN